MYYIAQNLFPLVISMGSVWGSISYFIWLAGLKWTQPGLGFTISYGDGFTHVCPGNASRNLLVENLKIAGITERVRIVKGDVLNLEFEDNTFDAAISVLLVNNLGKAKLKGLEELFRVLKPGRKILIIVPTFSLQTFAVMSVFSLILTSSNKWQFLFEQAGFSLLDTGIINFVKFFLLQK